MEASVEVSQKTRDGGVERCLSSHELTAPVEAGVWSPEPTLSSSELPVTPASGSPIPSSDLCDFAFTCTY